MEYTRNYDPKPDYKGDNVVMFNIQLPDLCEEAKKQQKGLPDYTELNSALSGTQVLESTK